MHLKDLNCWEKRKYTESLKGLTNQHRIHWQSSLPRKYWCENIYIFYNQRLCRDEYKITAESCTNLSVCLKKTGKRLRLLSLFKMMSASSVSKLTATCNILKRFQARKISTEWKNYPEGDWQNTSLGVLLFVFFSSFSSQSDTCSRTILSVLERWMIRSRAWLVFNS